MNIARIAIYRKEGFSFRRFVDVHRSKGIGRGYPFLVNGASGIIYSLMLVIVDQFWSSTTAFLSWFGYRWLKSILHSSHDNARLNSIRFSLAFALSSVRRFSISVEIPKNILSGVCPLNAECGITVLYSSINLLLVFLQWLMNRDYTWIKTNT